MPGTLYVVATPIGNLGDLTPRAREVLASVALIAAEDTRHTRQLLQTCGIGTALTSLHEHNEGPKSGKLVARLAQGDSIALVSDAGTPLVSDPGFDLVAAARQQGIAVVAIPGACAAIAALSVAGLPTHRFVFEGFLPAKAAARSARLQQLAREERTLIFYEAPHRLVEVLRDLTEIFGAQRRASISRELTKRFETTYSGTLAELSAAAERDSDMARGELVIVVSGAPAAGGAALELDADALLRALLQELSPSQAAKIAAHLTGGKRGELYEAALQIGRMAGPEKG
ncbi:MAG TPA: 16S rRNA (cytidine(1402)-2'-O)-methyltransferase [Steroidobacteraceae bacterium]|nr:16S rRNA (cytidine(1402)-2'-O)-methyltransferase [Steroidobacteraceae bacterium]